MKINKKKLNLRKAFLVALPIVLLFGVATTAALHIRNKNDQTKVIQQPGGPVTISPPTSQEQKEANTKKDEILKQQEAIDKTSTQAGKKQASPVITYVDQTGLSAYAAGVFEDGGTCTATVSQGVRTFQKVSNGFKDATTTSCEPIDFSASDFPVGGVWEVTLQYQSDNAQGVSKTVTFTVR